MLGVKVLLLAGSRRPMLLPPRDSKGGETLLSTVTSARRVCPSWWHTRSSPPAQGLGSRPVCRELQSVLRRVSGRATNTMPPTPSQRSSRDGHLVVSFWHVRNCNVGRAVLVGARCPAQLTCFCRVAQLFHVCGRRRQPWQRRGRRSWYSHKHNHYTKSRRAPWVGPK